MDRDATRYDTPEEFFKKNTNKILVLILKLTFTLKLKFEFPFQQNVFLCKNVDQNRKE